MGAAPWGDLRWTLRLRPGESPAPGEGRHIPREPRAPLRHVPSRPSTRVASRPWSALAGACLSRLRFPAERSP